MSSNGRDEELGRIDKELANYKVQWEFGRQVFAENLAKERAILDEAERSHGDQFVEEIKDARAKYDQAEREFLDLSSEALRAFEAAAEEARRSLG